MRDPLLIGMLLSRGDGDIIQEVMAEYCKQLDTIFCIDSSDDGSIDTIRSFDKVEYAVHEKDLCIEVSALRDGVRQLLLSQIQDRYGYDGWIFPIQTDEIYAGRLLHLVQHAEAEGANHVNALVAHFILHASEETEPNARSLGGSVQDARQWYFLGQCEVAGYKNQPGLYYNLFEHMRVLPHGFLPLKTCTRVGIRKHYNLRTVDQVEKRVKDRLSTGWQPAYARFSDSPFVSEVTEMTSVYFSPLQRFDGEFRFSPECEHWGKTLVF